MRAEWDAVGSEENSGDGEAGGGGVGGVASVGVEIKVEATGISIQPMGLAKESSIVIAGTEWMPVDAGNASSALSRTNKVHAVFEGKQKEAKVVTTVDSTEVREQEKVLIK